MAAAALTDVGTSAPARTVTVPGHVYGFPAVAFGGYVAGVLAQEFPGQSVKVAFRRPTPVGVPLTLRTGAGGSRELADGKGVLATARTCAPIGPPAAIPSWAQAERATKELERTGPPDDGDCFACNGDRPRGRGLRQAFAPLLRDSRAAAVWTPDPALNPGGTELPVELVWAGLDCPGGWVARLFGGAPEQTVTAHLAATLLRPVRLGEQHLAFGWPMSRSGRKYRVGSAIATRDGELCATAEALWLAPVPDAGSGTGG
ncbi:PaaI family thioesterase [Kitasatospora sp. NPDC050543]|uniref:PaaI family thioesterase n=1 Tax=Kitasatospora sp. NPDC050543 TaxID=3364054 RepID=UPI00379B4846